MKIDFANLDRAYKSQKDELDNAINAVVSSANFILGSEVELLEEELSKFTGSPNAITCSSGTDALALALMALEIKPGDEIITTPFSFIATAEVIPYLGAKPVFVDIDETTFNIDETKIEKAITKKTKAIIPVSLYGQTSNMKAINDIALEYKLTVIEDAAQSFGAEYNGAKSCNLSSIGCTSFFPAKPLGCFGDGGAFFTDNNEIAERVKSLRVHGQTERYAHKYIGMGGRLDALQAAVLRVKLRQYQTDLFNRQNLAEFYNNSIINDKLIKPIVKGGRKSAYAQYTLRVDNREQFRDYLSKNNIPTAVHYPIPFHLQECFNYLNYKKGDFPIAEKASNEVVSIPMNPYFTINEKNYIVDLINKY